MYLLQFFYKWRRIKFEVGEEEEIFGGRYFLYLFGIVMNLLLWVSKNDKSSGKVTLQVKPINGETTSFLLWIS